MSHDCDSEYNKRAFAFVLLGSAVLCGCYSPLMAILGIGWLATQACSPTYRTIIVIGIIMHIMWMIAYCALACHIAWGVLQHRY